MTDEPKAGDGAGDGPREMLDPPTVSSVEFTSRATDAPTIYCDGVLFATRLGSTVRITFFENILEAKDAAFPGLKARHVLNLVMPIEGYIGGMDYLDGVAKFILPQPKGDPSGD